jgi:hypothetical protein
MVMKSQKIRKHNLLFLLVASLIALTFSPISANAAPGDDLIVTTQPSGAVNDVVFTTQPVVEIQNSGVTDSSATDNITVSLATGSGTLSGTLTVAAVAGVASFTDLKIVGSGSHTLSFTASGLTTATSSSITPTVGAATQLIVATQPSGSVNDAAFTTQPIVEIQDSGGNVDTSDNSTVVTVAIATGSGTLSGTTTATASSGIATFSGLKIVGSGAHILSFTASGLSSATSSAITPAFGTASQLVVSTQPSGAITGSVFTTQPAVSIKDSGGNVDTSDNSTVVTVAITTGSGTLSGTTTATASSGVATFTDLVITGTGSHELIFTATGLSDDTSTSFSVSDVAPPAPAPVYIPKTPQGALVLTTSTNKLEWGSQGKLSVSGGSGTGKITYYSRGSAFCAVDKDGNFTPINSGTCKITATKEDDGTYASATSNTVEIVATDEPVATTASSSTSNLGDSMSVGTPVGGVSTVKFAISDTYAGQKVSVVLATKNSAGKTLSKTLGSAKVGATGAVTFKTKVKLPVGAVLKLKSAGSVIFSKTIE